MSARESGHPGGPRSRGQTTRRPHPPGTGVGTGARAPSVERMPQLPGTDLTVSELCLGGNVFGWTADEASSRAVLDR